MQSGTTPNQQLKTIPLNVVFGRLSWPNGPQSEPDRKLAWLKVIVGAGVICGLALSWRLWISSRLFPLTPVADFLPAIPFPLDYVLLLAMFVLLAAIIAVKRPRRLIAFFLAISALLSVGDQNRLQPWFYLYWFMLAAIGISGLGKLSPEKGMQADALNTCRLMLIATYFWSGLQKLNANFVRHTWPDMAGPFLRFLPQSARNLPPWLILMFPLVEIAIALGLLARKSRTTAAALAVGVHVFVLILLVSSGENTTVWPWNVAMILFVAVLFWRENAVPGSRILWARNGVHMMVLLMFAVLPALSFLDLWDSYLSSALYSGNTSQAAILVSPEVIPQLPAALRPHIWQKTQPYFLDINRWSYGELNVPLYPEPRVYRRVTQRVCEYAGHSSGIKLLIKRKPNLLRGARQSEYFDCDHLEEQ
jgi:hypothetical protein